jgi:hypothetical protein
MGMGLEIFDAQGVSIFDTTSVIGRLIGVIDASALNGSATVVGLDQGVPFAIPQLQQDPSYYGATINNNTYPVCTFNGNIVSWVRHPYSPGIGMPGCLLVLGVR